MSRASKSDAIVVRLRGVEVLAVPDTVTSFRCGKLPASASLILEQVFTLFILTAVVTVTVWARPRNVRRPMHSRLAAVIVLSPHSTAVLPLPRWLICPVLSC